MTALTTKTLVLCKLEQPSHGVSPRREHKDEGGTRIGVSKAPCKVKCRGFDVGPPHLVHYEVLHGGDHLVGSDAAKEHHPVGEEEQTMEEMKMQIDNERGGRGRGRGGGGYTEGMEIDLTCQGLSAWSPMVLVALCLEARESHTAASIGDQNLC